MINLTLSMFAEIPVIGYAYDTTLLTNIPEEIEQEISAVNKHSKDQTIYMKLKIKTSVMSVDNQTTNNKNK